MGRYHPLQCLLLLQSKVNNFQFKIHKFKIHEHNLINPKIRVFYNQVGGNEAAKKEFGQIAVQTAYDNRETIKQVAIDNKDTIKQVAIENKDVIIDFAKENRQVVVQGNATAGSW